MIKEGGQLDSFRINFIAFRTFRGPLFNKQETGIFKKQFFFK